MRLAKVTLRSLAAWAALLVALSACGEASETGPNGNIPLDDLVALLVTGDFVDLTPGGTTSYLSGIVEVAPQPAREYRWVFAGEAVDSGIRWAQAEFESDTPNAAHGWRFVDMKLALPLSDNTGKSVYDALTKGIREKLGKPDASEAAANRRISAWHVRERGALTVLEAELMHPDTREETRGVLVTVAIMAGEEEG